MPYPTIVFNANTGSDTQASGAPASFGPIFGNNANTTNGSTTIDLSTDNPDLSGVPTDGSAVIFVKTTTSRRFFRILGKDNVAKTVTVDITADATGTFMWAIGGKRATFNNADSKYAISNPSSPFWTIQTETDQNLTSDLSIYVWNHLRGDRTEPPLRTISWNFNGRCLLVGSSTGNRAIISNLRFINTYATKTANIYAIDPGAYGIEVYNCIFGDPNPANTLYYGITGLTGQLTKIENCIFRNCVSHGIYYTSLASSDSYILFINTVFSGNGGHGLNMSFNTVYRMYLDVVDCIFYDNLVGLHDQTGYATNDPLYGWRSRHFYRNTFCQNRSHGIQFGAPLSGAYRFDGTHIVHSNIFYQNGGYGIDGSGLQDSFTGADSKKVLIDHNCYYQNTSGATNNYPTGPNDIFVDPQFANPANLDFRVGPNLKAKGWPKFDVPIGAGQTNTYTFIDCGAAQRKEPPPKTASRIFIPSFT